MMNALPELEQEDKKYRLHIVKVDPPSNLNLVLKMPESLLSKTELMKVLFSEGIVK